MCLRRPRGQREALRREGLARYCRKCSTILAIVYESKQCEMDTSLFPM